VALALARMAALLVALTPCTRGLTWCIVSRIAWVSTVTSPLAEQEQLMIEIVDVSVHEGGGERVGCLPERPLQARPRGQMLAHQASMVSAPDRVTLYLLCVTA